MTASYLEIYNDSIRDLLVKKPTSLELKRHPERGCFVKDLKAIVVKNVSEVQKILQVGKKHRAVGSTAMNNQSSRSHSIFMLNIESAIVSDLDGESHIRAGKLNLVDLAGSERLSKTQATGSLAKEGCMINLSLSALGNVITALVDSKTNFVPYRDSKLTVSGSNFFFSFLFRRGRESFFAVRIPGTLKFIVLPSLPPSPLSNSWRTLSEETREPS